MFAPRYFAGLYYAALYFPPSVVAAGPLPLPPGGLLPMPGPVLPPPVVYPDEEGGWYYPQDQLDDLRVYALFPGAFWTNLYGGKVNVLDLLRSWRSAERQLFLQLQELQDTVGRLTCPPYHVRNWYEFTLLLSQGVPAGAASQAVSYPLPAGVRDCLLAATDSVNPTKTWHAGCSLWLDPSAGLLTLDQNPFSDPAVLPTPVLDADGNVVDLALTLWLFKAALDWQYPYDQFGHVVGLGAGLPSSQPLLDLINAVWDCLTVGPGYGPIGHIIEALTGVPFCAVDNEIVQELAADPDHALVITDQRVYRFVPGVTFLVGPGQVMRHSQPFIDAVTLFEPRSGAAPPGLTQLALGPDLLTSALSGELVFVNAAVSLNIATGVSGYTKLTWYLGGAPADVTLFFNDLHARGVAGGATLANYLDLRPAGSPGQPGPADLPSTINPLQFLFQNVFRAHGLVVSVRPSQFGDEALGMDLAGVLRTVLPPQAAVLLVTDPA